jgi:flagellar protein FlaF
MHQLAHKAYTDVTSRTASDKHLEYAVFQQITDALKDVAAQDVPLPAVWVDAIDRNMQLWLTLSIDLLSETNEMDPHLRMGLLTLAEMVRKLSYRVLAGEEELTDVIEINEMVMRGLSGDTGSQLSEVTQ